MAGEAKSKQQVQKQEEKTTNFSPPVSTQKSPAGDKRFNVEIPTVSLSKGGGASYLLSGHIDDTQGGKLRPSNANYSKAQQTQQKSRATSVINNTSSWNKSTSTTPAAGSANIFPHVTSSFINVIP